jgi:hypothetical protein|tara:strand:- start:265 stop:663 length:399 start_codon:yes stop_codon:yes gene_type:complete
MIQVPVSDLLQMTHPGFMNIKNDANLSHLPAILDYSRCLVERFEHYGDVKVSPSDMFPILGKMFETLSTEDEPEIVLPIRMQLPRVLEEFEAMTEKMCEAFPMNWTIKKIYRDISEYFYEMFDMLTGGEIND